MPFFSITSSNNDIRQLFRVGIDRVGRTFGVWNATPPIGVVLFVTSNGAKVPFDRVTKATLLFISPLLFTLLWVALWSPLTTWLPWVLVEVNPRMDDSSLLHLFEGGDETPSPELVVAQIRRLISRGALRPGDMLPPERKLSEKLGISRGHIRKGLKKLELYGIVKSVQGSGTFVTDLGIQTMGGVMGNLLKLSADDILALNDTRMLLEAYAAKRAAEYRTETDAAMLRQIIEKMRLIVDDTEKWLEMDLSLHVKIAEASHNPVLLELIKFMTPNIMGYYRKFLSDRIVITLAIHEEIVSAIVKGDPVKAEKAMLRHLDGSRREFESILQPVGAATDSRAKSERRKARVETRRTARPSRREQNDASSGDGMFG